MTERGMTAAPCVVALAVVLLFPLMAAGPSRGEIRILTSSTSAPTPPSDPAGRAAFGVLERHCSRCHQEGRLVNRPRPAKSFGNILRLDEIARSPHLIIPGRPEQSKLFRQVIAKEMPYDFHYELADVPAVEDADVTILRDWISQLGAQPQVQSAAISVAEPRLLSSFRIQLLSIGVDNYPGLKLHLKNPEKDAFRIAQAVGKRTWESDGAYVQDVRVALLRSPKRDDVERLLDSMRSEAADLRLVFFAGASTIIGGQPHLLLPDAKFDEDKKTFCGAIPVSAIARHFRSVPGRLAVIVDGLGSSSKSAGAELDPACAKPGEMLSEPDGQASANTDNVLVAFSSGLNGVALDQDPTTQEEGSPFALALARRLATECRDLEFVLEAVRFEVFEKTESAQRQLPEVTVRPSVPMKIFPSVCPTRRISR